MRSLVEQSRIPHDHPNNRTPPTMTGHRSGFVGLIGRPNVGKSTILNYYVGEPVAIVSPKPQTTRQRILGVLTRPDAQVAFLDTPGFHRPEHSMGRHMVEVAKAVAQEADVWVVVIDGRAGLTRDDERLFSYLREAQSRTPTGDDSTRHAVVAINKVDVVKKPLLLPLLDRCAKTGLFAECIPVSALTGEQMDVLLEEILKRLPEGPPWYEPVQRTDQTTDQRIRELIREQVLLDTHEEVPHAVGVLIDQLETTPKLISIQATLFVERSGQKAILIGQHGQRLKQIGQGARRKIEQLVGRKVYLGLWVKVAPNWRHDERILRQLGYVGGSA